MQHPLPKHRTRLLEFYAVFTGKLSQQLFKSSGVSSGAAQGNMQRAHRFATPNRECVEVKASRPKSKPLLNIIVHSVSFASLRLVLL